MPVATIDAAHARPGATGARRLGGPDALLVAIVGLVGVFLLVGIRYAFMQDAWLGLVGGREVWNNGIPQHDALTVLAEGRRWIDQQWLSQLAMYGLDRLGGLAVVAVAHTVLTIGSLGVAVVAGRRLGTGPRTMAFLLLPCALLVLLASVRTQPYAYPLFVGTVYLLATDSRRPSRRVLWTLALLVLWSNVHGSVVLGAGLVSLRGATSLVEGRGRALSATLLVAPAVCLLATPYGLATAGYYGDTLFNNDFGRVVTEWKPVTTVAIAAVPFFALAAAAVWSMGRHPGRLTPWEQIALLLLLVGGILAVRNVVWAALALLVLPVVVFPAPERRREAREGINRALATTSGAGVVVLLALTLTRADGYFQSSYPTGALAGVRSATREPGVDVFAGPRVADWLLWRDPGLRGRIAFDIRFELLPGDRLSEVADALAAKGVDFKHAVRGFRVVALAPDEAPEAARAFRAEPGRRILFENDDALVVLRAGS